MSLRKKGVQVFVIITAAGILSAHIVALFFSLYWRFKELDEIMHFVGGLWLAAVAAWILFFSGLRVHDRKECCREGEIACLKNNWSLLVLALAIVALGGVLWEFFEFFLDVYLNGHGYAAFMQPTVSDTMSDLAFDFLGGLLGWVIISKTLSFNHGSCAKNEQARAS